MFAKDCIVCDCKHWCTLCCTSISFDSLYPYLHLKQQLSITYQLIIVNGASQKYLWHIYYKPRNNCGCKLIRCYSNTYIYLYILHLYIQEYPTTLVLGTLPWKIYLITINGIIQKAFTRIQIRDIKYIYHNVQKIT